MDKADPIPTFGAWMSRQQRSQAIQTPEKRRFTRNRGKHTQGHQYIHNPLSEPLPDHAWFNLDTALMSSRTNEIIDKLLEVLKSMNMDTNELSDLRESLERCRNGPSMAELIISMIGQGGIGKSSLINALLARPYLADVLGGSKACTKHGTRYEYLPGAPDDSKTSSVKLQIAARSDREGNTREHVRNYQHYHHSRGEDDQELQSEQGNVDEMNESFASEPDSMVLVGNDRKRANDALEFFHIVWDTANDPAAKRELESLLNTASVRDETLYGRCIEKQQERIEKLGVNDDGIAVFEDVPDLCTSSSALDTKDIKAIRQFAASLWPLIDMVIIATGSRLLRNGIVLIDLPGMESMQWIEINCAQANLYRLW